MYCNALGNFPVGHNIYCTSVLLIYCSANPDLLFPFFPLCPSPPNDLIFFLILYTAMNFSSQYMLKKIEWHGDRAKCVFFLSFAFIWSLLFLLLLVPFHILSSFSATWRSLPSDHCPSPTCEQMMRWWCFTQNRWCVEGGNWFLMLKGH